MDCRCISGKFLVKRTALWLSLLPLLSLPNYAEADGNRHHEAHIHGVGQLNIVLDEDLLLLELRSPVANIVGFEHAPENAEQEAALQEATALLKQSDKSFLLSPGAQCKAGGVNFQSTVLDHEGDEHHDHHDHDDHQEGDDHHSHDAHDASGHGEEASAHSEFVSTSVFQCADMTELEAIEVQLFSIFPGFEEIEVQLQSPGGQKAYELTPDNFRIQLQHD